MRAKELVVQFYGSVCFVRRTAISLSPLYAVSSLQQLKLSDPPLPVFKHPINLNAPFHIPKLDFEQPFKGSASIRLCKRHRQGLADTFGLNVNSAFLTLVILVLINGTLGLFIAFGAIGEELGWRGFLVPELYKHFNYTKTSFISGAIWAVFHCLLS